MFHCDRLPDAMHSSNKSPWHGWYNTSRWRRLRLTVFQRDMFTCQMPACGRLEGNTSLLVCDHRVAHRGDATLFWDDANLQTLCKSCHDSVKQKSEQQTLNERGVWY